MFFSGLFTSALPYVVFLSITFAYLTFSFIQKDHFFQQKRVAYSKVCADGHVLASYDIIDAESDAFQKQEAKIHNNQVDFVVAASLQNTKIVAPSLPCYDVIQGALFCRPPPTL